MKRAFRTNLNVDSYPAICQATIARDVRLLNWFIAQGEDVNRQTASYSNFTPLHWAVALHDTMDIAQILVDAGADVDIRAKDRKTPLHRAIVRGAIEPVQFLIVNGVNIEIEWSAELTPHMPIAPAQHAILRGDVEIFRALVRAGCETTWSALSLPPGNKYTATGGESVHAVEYISRMQNHHPEIRDMMLQVLVDNRPEEVLDVWTAQP